MSYNWLKISIYTYDFPPRYQLEYRKYSKFTTVSPELVEKREGNISINENRSEEETDKELMDLAVPELMSILNSIMSPGPDDRIYIHYPHGNSFWRKFRGIPGNFCEKILDHSLRPKNGKSVKNEKRDSIILFEI
jgi:hypothetical protein